MGPAIFEERLGTKEGEGVDAKFLELEMFEFERVGKLHVVCQLNAGERRGCDLFCATGRVICQFQIREVWQKIDEGGDGRPGGASWAPCKPPETVGERGEYGSENIKGWKVSIEVVYP